MPHSASPEAVGLPAGLVHEFNNVLQIIGGNLELAARLLSRCDGGPPDAERVEQAMAAIARAQKASQSATELVQRMPAFSPVQNSIGASGK